MHGFLKLKRENRFLKQKKVKGFKRVLKKVQKKVGDTNLSDFE